MQEMGHEPETSLEKEAVCSDDDVFLLTHDNIKALKLLLCQVPASLPTSPCSLGMPLVCFRAVTRGLALRIC